MPLDTDRRLCTPVARHSYKWLDAYKRRTDVERVFSRVDGVFGFEHHTVRGFAKMEARITLALLVNVSMALARVRQGQAERLRSLVAPLRRAA